MLFKLLNADNTSAPVTESSDTTSTALQHGPSAPQYGEPGGGQHSQECGLLAINFALRAFHLPLFSEADLLNIARILEQREPFAAGIAPYKHSTSEGCFSIQCVLTALQQRGEAGYIQQNTDLSPTTSFIINRHDHYVTLLNIDDIWMELNSMRPTETIPAIDIYLAQYRGQSRTAVLWFRVSSNIPTSTSSELQISPPGPISSVSSSTTITTITTSISVPSITTCTTTAAAMTTTIITSTLPSTNYQASILTHVSCGVWRLVPITNIVLSDACGRAFGSRRACSCHQTRYCTARLSSIHVSQSGDSGAPQ